MGRAAWKYVRWGCTMLPGTPVVQSTLVVKLHPQLGSLWSVSSAYFHRSEWFLAWHGICMQPSCSKFVVTIFPEDIVIVQVKRDSLICIPLLDSWNFGLRLLSFSRGCWLVHFFLFSLLLHCILDLNGHNHRRMHVSLSNLSDILQPPI